MERPWWRSRWAPADVWHSRTMVEDFRESVRERVRMVPAGPPPAPWRSVAVRSVGGLTEVGIGSSAAGEEFVLVVSGTGRGVVSTGGEVVARDHDDQLADWYEPIELVATGIGPLAGQRVRLAGLAGGGLALDTADGWSVGRYPVDWPDERVILEPPNTGVLWPGHESGCVTLLGPDLPHEVRTVGFSRTGRLLVIATSGDLALYTR
jgi:hypothetical protein